MNCKLTATVAFVLMSGCDVLKDYVTEPYVIYLNQLAIEKLKDEKAVAPQEEILNALEVAPERVELQTNLGLSFSRNKKLEETEKSLLEALRLSLIQKNVSELKKFENQFTANYNLGVFYGLQKKIKEALEYYQKALDLLPTSKEVKTNIELLWQSNQQNQDGEGQDEQPKDGDKDQKDQKDPKDGDSDQKDKKDPKEDEGKERKQSGKYKPRPFESQELSEGDMKKMLEELGRQDKKIRSQFNNRKNQKSNEDKNEKDW